LAGTHPLQSFECPIFSTSSLLVAQETAWFGVHSMKEEQHITLDRTATSTGIKTERQPSIAIE
jgi:hypothetical protein